MSGRGNLWLLAALTASVVAFSSAIDALARHKISAQSIQSGDNQVSMEFFPIQKGYDGAQFIVTKAGYTVSIPGLGVAPDANQIAAYKDEQNNIW